VGHRPVDRHAYRGGAPYGCLRTVASAARHASLPEHVLAERLLLAIYGYGTNTGIRAVAAGEHGHTDDDIRYARRRYLSLEAARQIAIESANATFAARQQTLWGDGSTAVASARPTSGHSAETWPGLAPGELENDRRALGEQGGGGLLSLFFCPTG
jgi:Tn3 transposase DDE domain